MAVLAAMDFCSVVCSCYPQWSLRLFDKLPEGMHQVVGSMLVSGLTSTCEVVQCHAVCCGRRCKPAYPYTTEACFGALAFSVHPRWFAAALFLQSAMERHYTCLICLCPCMGSSHGVVCAAQLQQCLRERVAQRAVDGVSLLQPP